MTGPPWIGLPCQSDWYCDFSADGVQGFCYVTEHLNGVGFCSLPCDGYCPDLSGTAGTFCISDGDSGGMCTSKADPLNGNCTGIPGTRAKEMGRFIYLGQAPDATALVCID